MLVHESFIIIGQTGVLPPSLVLLKQISHIIWKLFEWFKELNETKIALLSNLKCYNWSLKFMLVAIIWGIPWCDSLLILFGFSLIDLFLKPECS